ncbi:MAG: histidine kinase [Armatimonadetes bacterium]|nr:histidine kinase [Armatimonadota bacterium]
MPYRYRCLDPQGALRDGLLPHTSQEEARLELTGRGWHILQLTAAGSAGRDQALTTYLLEQIGTAAVGLLAGGAAAWIAWLLVAGEEAARLQLLHRFGSLAVISLVVLVLEQLHRRVLPLQSQIRRNLAAGATAGLCSALLSLPLTIAPPAVFPLLFGCYSGRWAGIASGTAVGLLGWSQGRCSPLEGFLLIGAGLVGASCSRWSSQARLVFLGLAAFGWSALGPDREATAWLIPQSLAMGLGTASLGRLVEYLFEAEQRRSARTVSKLVHLLDRIAAPGASPVSQKLCRTLKEATGADLCLSVLPDLRVVSSDPEQYPHQVRGEALHSLFQRGEAQLGPHADFLVCHDCSLGEAVFFPLTDGKSVVAALGLLSHREHPLSGADRTLIQGLSSILSFELVSRRLHQQGMELERTRFRFLTAQIRPHFLFNALNTVAAVISTDPARAEELILDLADFLRQTFRVQAEWVPLSEEIGYLNAYLALEQARFGERLRIELEVPPEARDLPVPSLLVQPLVENSIRHGVSARPEGGTVRLRVRAAEGGFEFLVEDDGVGFPAATDLTTGSLPPATDSGGVGLTNVRERLLSLLGERARFHLASEPGKGCRISYFIPRPSALPRPAGREPSSPSTAAGPTDPASGGRAPDAVAPG